MTVKDTLLSAANDFAKTAGNLTNDEVVKEVSEQKNENAPAPDPPAIVVQNVFTDERRGFDQVYRYEDPDDSTKVVVQLMGHRRAQFNFLGIGSQAEAWLTDLKLNANNPAVSNTHQGVLFEVPQNDDSIASVSGPDASGNFEARYNMSVMGKYSVLTEPITVGPEATTITVSTVLSDVDFSDTEVSVQQN